jgi:hypothetical protein
VVRTRGHVDDGTITAEQLNNALDVLGMALYPSSGDRPQ